MPCGSSPESLAAQIGAVVLLVVRIGAMLWTGIPRRKRL